MDIRIEKTHLDEVVSAMNNALSTILKLKKEQKEREALKQSSIPLDYEILKCENNCFGVHDYVDFKDSNTPCLKADHPCTIFSVRRIEDNEIFTVGDDEKDGKITKFELIGNTMVVTID